MKLSKKFIEDLHKIGEDAFIEKNQWIGKLVPDIIVDNLQKRGINQGDLEGVVCLSVEEAKILLECACCVDAYTFNKYQKLFDCLKTRIELVEVQNESD